MSVIKVEHTCKLVGEIDVQGSKNAVLPMLAASILNKGCTVIYGCPDIADVRNTIEILNYIGCKTKWESDKLEIDATCIERWEIPKEYSEKLRSSIVFLGALLARGGKAGIAYPGGCCIGARPVDIHLDSLEKMNVDITEGMEAIGAETTRLRGRHIKLKFPSVGATQNILLCAVVAEGVTTIENYAREPEIYDLCNFLTGMGASIKMLRGCIKVVGVKSLHDSEYRVCGDRIVAGTYMFMTAMTGGDITVNNIDSTHLTCVLKKLSETGCDIRIYKNKIRIMKAENRYIRSLPFVETEPFPGFPTDLQAFMTVLMSVGATSTLLKENIFENRFHTARELAGMGANINFVSDEMIQINGVTKLYGRKVSASDLRDGAALVMAGLYADGETIVSNAHIINRGYEDIVRDLRVLGAKIGYN